MGRGCTESKRTAILSGLTIHLGRSILLSLFLNLAKVPLPMLHEERLEKKWWAFREVPGGPVVRTRHSDC